MTSPTSAHLPLAALGVAFVALAVLYQQSVPLFEAPDEPSHLQYVGFLAVEQRLPLYGAEPDVPGEGMQPPLYYAVAAPLFRWLVDDPQILMRDLRDVNRSIYQHIPQQPRADMVIRHPVRHRVRQFAQSPALEMLRPLRWTSLGFGLLAVVLSYFAALRAFGNPAFAALAAGLLAFNPQFLFCSAYVSNDSAAVAVGAGVLWLSVAALCDETGGRRRNYLLAAMAGVFAVLTKNSILPGLGLAALLIFGVDRRPVAQRLRDTALAAGLFALFAGPYLAWNLVNRGDLLGVGAFWQGASHMLGFEAYGGAFAYFTGMYWTWTFESYWARFGWINVRVPNAVYFLYLALSVGGVAGFWLAGRRERTSAPGSRDLVFPGAFRFYLAVAALLTLAAHLWFNAFAAQPQGRHLFPAAPQIAVLLAIGIAHWTRGEPARVDRKVALATLLPLGGLAAWACLGVIVPAYR